MEISTELIKEWNKICLSKDLRVGHLNIKILNKIVMQCRNSCQLLDCNNFVVPVPMPVMQLHILAKINTINIVGNPVLGLQHQPKDSKTTINKEVR